MCSLQHFRRKWPRAPALGGCGKSPASILAGRDCEVPPTERAASRHQLTRSGARGAIRAPNGISGNAPRERLEAPSGPSPRTEEEPT